LIRVIPFGDSAVGPHARIISPITRKSAGSANSNGRVRAHSRKCRALSDCFDLTDCLPAKVITPGQACSPTPPNATPFARSAGPTVLTLECGPRFSVDLMPSTLDPPAARTVLALAREVGVSADTIRYYERAGLLPEPHRTATGYRQYGPAAVDRLRFIQGAQRLGLRLREIRDLLAVRDTGVCPCEPAGQLLRRHIAELAAEVDRLNKLRTELVEMVEHLPGPDCPNPTPGTWCPEDPDGR
jgi:DNA-binding transcriptional MerR regulator